MVSNAITYLYSCSVGKINQVLFACVCVCSGRSPGGLKVSSLEKAAIKSIFISFQSSLIRDSYDLFLSKFVLKIAFQFLNAKENILGKKKKQTNNKVYQTLKVMSWLVKL